MNELYDFLKFIHNAIVNWNAYRISPIQDAVASNSHCQVMEFSRKQFCIFLIKSSFYIFIGDTNTAICGSRSIDCYNIAEDVLLEQFYKDGLDEKANKEKFREGLGCNCLPSCTSIAYDAEISQAKFDWKATFRALESAPEEYPG